MMLVSTLVLNVIDDGRTDDDQFQAIPVHLAIGFLIVAAIFTAAGFMISKTLAWTLAGLSGGAASIGLQFEETRGRMAVVGGGHGDRRDPVLRLRADPAACAGRRRLPHPAEHLARLALPDHRQRARRRAGPDRRRWRC